MTPYVDSLKSSPFFVSRTISFLYLRSRNRYLFGLIFLKVFYGYYFTCPLFQWITKRLSSLFTQGPYLAPGLEDLLVDLQVLNALRFGH